MNIYQMQQRYQPATDRLLRQLRTTGGGLAHEMPHAAVVPEARAMLAQAIRERLLSDASLAETFGTCQRRSPWAPTRCCPRPSTWARASTARA